MIPAFISDMDGTLCDVSSIRYHVNPRDPKFTGKKRFDRFHEESIDCPPHPEASAWFRQALMFGLAPVIVTARKEMWRYHTILWLDENGFEYDELFMREDGDNRPDYEVKRDILARIKSRYTPVLALDDNPAVIALWAEFGIETVTIPGWEEQDE